MLSNFPKIMHTLIQEVFDEHLPLHYFLGSKNLATKELDSFFFHEAYILIGERR